MRREDSGVVVGISAGDALLSGVPVDADVEVDFGDSWKSMVFRVSMEEAGRWLFKRVKITVETED